jgi:hypothetical protein
MAELLLRGKPIHSVFQLLGDHENDITYSVGWALARSPAFLQAFLDAMVVPSLDSSKAILRLQEYASGQGITDIEIEAAGTFHVIVEAKRGWTLPTQEQLTTYAARFTVVGQQASHQRLVVLSECSREYALLHLPARQIGEAPIVPLSWRELAGLATTARAVGAHTEKRLLEELDVYLRGLMTMQNVDSNWVYVVVLSHDQAPSWGCSWIEIVTLHHHYTHAVGISGWPKEPPNYLAFRYDGQLQSIHHVEGYEVVTSLVGKVPAVRDESWNPQHEPQFFYTLGPAFRPNEVVPTGNIYPNGRVWCMLDTLFTANTIAEARDISRERAAQAGESAGRE